MPSYANNKGADQPAYQRSLISAFVIRCLDGIIHSVSITTLLRQVSLSFTGSQTSEDRFALDVAHNKAWQIYTLKDTENENNKIKKETGAVFKIIYNVKTNVCQSP